ncbi:MAG: VOC family protein [Acidimicrobiaceae bacterium]|nr:VOC family protein [Acidimicrobiaceae bacterium]
MADDPVVFNHVGLCVTDLERARAFYEQALGFRYWWELEAPDEPTSVLLQLPQPVGLKAVYLVRDGLVLELLCYGPAAARPGRERSMAEPGLTHLSLSVADMERALEQVVAHGGQVLKQTDIKAAIIIRDPDGQLIELTTSDWQAALPPLPE